MVRTTGLDSLEPEELKELLLATTEGRADGRFFVEPRLHPAIELQRHDERAPAARKARIKRALVDAVAEWRRRAHGLGVLRFLAQAAAALRARPTAPHFERVLGRQRLLVTPPDGGDDVAAAVVSTLAGFAPGDRIGALLERLYFTPGLRLRLAGVILQGLCRCAREELPRHLERYLRLLEPGDRHHFENPIFLRAFVESLTPNALAASWPDLDTRLRAFLLESLGTLDRAGSPELFFAIEQGGATLHVVAAGHHEQFELRSRTVGGRFDDLHRAYGLTAVPPPYLTGGR